MYSRWVHRVCGEEPERRRNQWSRSGPPASLELFAEAVEHSFGVQEVSLWSGRPRRLIDIEKNRTYVILDLGCTKAMGPRKAIVAFIRSRSRHGLKCELLPTYGKFNFASSQLAVCRHKCRVWLRTKPPFFTDFDMVEEGTVPMLMSLKQMRNMRLQLRMTPTRAKLFSPMIGSDPLELEVSTTNHLALDLTKIQNSEVLKPSDVSWPRGIRACGDGRANGGAKQALSCLCRKTPRPHAGDAED